MKINLKRLIKYHIQRLICAGKIIGFITRFDDEDLFPAVLYSFQVLDSQRESYTLDSEYYALTLKKYWKKYKSLPDFMKIKSDDLGFFTEYLEDNLEMLEHKKMSNSYTPFDSLFEKTKKN